MEICRALSNKAHTRVKMFAVKSHLNQPVVEVCMKYIHIHDIPDLDALNEADRHPF